MIKPGYNRPPRKPLSDISGRSRVPSRGAAAPGYFSSCRGFFPKNPNIDNREFAPIRGSAPAGIFCFSRAIPFDFDLYLLEKLFDRGAAARTEDGFWPALLTGEALQNATEEPVRRLQFRR